MRGQPPEPTVDLTKLHDLMTPAPVSYAPATVGWYIVAGLVILLIGWLVLRWIAHRRATRYRREALGELTRIESRLRGSDRAAALIDLDVLVKRVALAAYPRVDVAALAGDAWLRFLDRSTGGRRFASGDGRPLGDLPYAPIAARESLPADGAQRLVDAVRAWIREHRVSV